MDLTLGEFLKIKNGTFEFHGNKGILDHEIAGISIDSRTISPGQVFFALRGENHDGHDYVNGVLTKQATAAVVEKTWWSPLSSDWHGGNVFVVENTLLALQQLAHFYRKKFDLPILGLTGTNGKTTTKEMVAAVLSRMGSVCKTKGNLNNHIGLPLTLFSLNHEHQSAVLELGTNHFGEIARLCEIADPGFGLITNVGHGHLEFLGDLDGVARAKMELFEYVRADGVAFVNLDDPLIVKYLPQNMRMVTFGFKEEATVLGRDLGIDEQGFPTLLVEKTRIKVNVPGAHNAANALAAVAVGQEFGVPLNRIKEALENVEVPHKRMEIEKRRNVTIINDSYNANPDSTRAALEVLRSIKVSGKRIFVFGDMLELGGQAEEEHRKVGESLQRFNVQCFFAFGPESRFAVEAAKRSAKKIRAWHFQDKTELVNALKAVLEPGDVILIKGSRGMQMEDILDQV